MWQRIKNFLLGTKDLSIYADIGPPKLKKIGSLTYPLQGFKPLTKPTER